MALTGPTRQQVLQLMMTRLESKLAQTHVALTSPTRQQVLQLMMTRWGWYSLYGLWVSSISTKYSGKIFVAQIRLPQHYAYFSYPLLGGWGYRAKSYKREVKIKKANLRQFIFEKQSNIDCNSIKGCKKEVTVQLKIKNCWKISWWPSFISYTGMYII